MYVIVTYDVGSKRVRKALRICRKYLQSVHRSVFEGKLTERELRTMKQELKRVIDCDHDSIRIYLFESMRYAAKQDLGMTVRPPKII